LDYFNNLVLLLELIIYVRTIVILFVVSINKTWNRSIKNWRLLEIIWTIFPAFILIFIGIPSISLLYSSEKERVTFNLKIVGHQWYWEYSFPEFERTQQSLPAYLVEYYRMLESDLLILPFCCQIQGLITSQDVLHSWCVNSLGFKFDACPGRLNYFIFERSFPGVMFGQCSELCGSFHSWMPIYIEFVSSLFIH